MPDPIAPTSYRSPFVARLVANALLDGLMQAMHVAGVIASEATLAALHDLHAQIDGRVRDVAPAIPHRLPRRSTDTTAAEVQSLLSELHSLIDRLSIAQDHLPAMLVDPRQPPLPFEGPGD